MTTAASKVKSERAPIDPNGFEQRKVECMEMRQFAHARHGENQPEYSAAKRERHALGKHLPQQPETPRS